MKKSLIILVLLILILSGAAMPLAAQSSSAADKGSFNGTYAIKVTVDGGKQYPATIGVEDLKNGKIKVTSQYDGIPITVIGNVKGNAAKAGAVCRFKGEVPELFSGSAMIKIVKNGNEYRLTGEGSGSYTYNGSIGEGAGKAVGLRTSPELPKFGAAGTFAALAYPLRTFGLIKSILLASAVFFMIYLIVRAVRPKRRENRD